MKTIMVPEVGDLLDGNTVVVKVREPFIAGLITIANGYGFVTCFVGPTAEVAAGELFDDIDSALANLDERAENWKEVQNYEDNNNTVRV